MDQKQGYDRETFPTGAAEQKTSPSPPHGGKEFPFPPFPPAESSTLHETFTTYLKNRDGETSRHKQRPRSHSRSASSISNLLLVATERLGQETSRANAADLRCAEVLSHLRTIVEDRDQLRRSLAKVQEELGLYKLQLDVAQNEIFRAQKIVDGVDKARVEAEEQAAKDRTIARQLVSEREVWVAREEGRNEGFQEGLRQGRRWAFEAARRRPDEYTVNGGGYEEELDEEPETYEPSARPSSPSNRRAWSSPSRSVRSTLPDAASYASTLPANAITPAAPSNAPSTQTQPSTPRRSPPERSPSARSSRPLPRAPSRLPEPIDIRPDRNTPHIRATSPSMSHRSMALPPDGFIPTVGADSVISLPPPHELSRPVSFVDEDTLRTPATVHGADMLTRGRTMSNVSRGSTRLSEYDILSPPRAQEAPVSRSDQVAQQWRAANSNPPQRRPSTAEDVRSENFSTRSSQPRSQMSRRTGPRRPREIVMPMPLSTSMHAAGMSYTRPSTSGMAPRDHQPPALPSAPAGPSSAPGSAPYAPANEYYAAHPAQQGYAEDMAPTRPRSAIAWIKTRFNRSFSASSVPNIQIEPPSNPASNPSTDNTVNNVLLAPDDAGHVTLPQQFVPELAQAVAGVHAAQPDTAGAGAGSLIVLPDNQLPPGFVPLSPILPSLHSITPFPLDPPAAPKPATSPQPPAYSPRDIYGPPRPATAAAMRSPSSASASGSGGGGGGSGGGGRARVTSIGSAMLQTSPAPLNRPLSIFSET
ncbi:hypothetical protein C8R43DRAFT_696695 [Mycena crocata]|nr:hypothetical protein C8R43DRAFT_696695 [Mycena crocata]